MNRSLVKHSLLFLAFAVVIGLGLSTVYRAGPYEFGGKHWGSKRHRCDFTVYHEAGKAVLAGTDIYEAHNCRDWFFIYPPLFALVAVPFALLPVFWAVLLWYLLSVAMVGWAVWLCVKMVQASTGFQRDVLWLYALPPVLLLWPLLSALARGQTTPVLLGLVMAGFFYHWRGRDLLGGIYLAAAVLLKVFPVLLLAYFVWQRRWVFVASTLVAMAVGAFLLPAMVWGWQRNLTYLREWTSKVGAPSVESEAERAENPLYSQLHSSYLPRNQSLKAVLARLTHQPNAPYGAGVGAVMLVVTAVIAWRQRADLNPLLLLSAAVVWTLLISPVSWSHYFMLLLLPLTVLLATQTLPARIALIVFGVAGFVAAGNKTLQGYGLLCWGTFGLWVALMVLLTRRSTGMCCE